MDAYSSNTLALLFFVFILTLVEIMQNGGYGEFLYKKFVMLHDLFPYNTIQPIGNVIFGIVKLGFVFGLGYALCEYGLMIYGGIQSVFSSVSIAMHILFLVAAIIFDLFTTFKKSLAKKYFSRKVIFAAGLLLYTLFMQFILPQLLFSFPDSM